MFILVLILLLKAENHSRRRGRKESRSIEHVGRFRLRGEFERGPSSSRDWPGSTLTTARRAR